MVCWVCFLQPLHVVCSCVKRAQRISSCLCVRTCPIWLWSCPKLALVPVVFFLCWWRQRGRQGTHECATWGLLFHEEDLTYHMAVPALGLRSRHPCLKAGQGWVLFSSWAIRVWIQRGVAFLREGGTYLEVYGTTTARPHYVPMEGKQQKVCLPNLCLS